MSYLHCQLHLNLPCLRLLRAFYCTFPLGQGALRHSLFFSPGQGALRRRLLFCFIFQCWLSCCLFLNTWRPCWFFTGFIRKFGIGLPAASIIFTLICCSPFLISIANFYAMTFYKYCMLLTFCPFFCFGLFGWPKAELMVVGGNPGRFSSGLTKPETDVRQNLS